MSRAKGKKDDNTGPAKWVGIYTMGLAGLVNFTGLSGGIAAVLALVMFYFGVTSKPLFFFSFWSMVCACRGCRDGEEVDRGV